ncbi:MAG: FAD-dependent monooxygenase, partial [Actinomycetota bacterium]
RLLDAGTPTITRTSFRYGDDAMSLDIRPEPGMPGLAAPRRTLLDPVLVDAAVEAGAEVLHETRFLGVTSDRRGRVTGIRLRTADGAERTVSAALVVGADGVRSAVAREVGATITRRGRHASAATLRYYRDLDVPRDEFRWMYRPSLGGGLIPTSGDAVCVFAAMEPERFRLVRGDVGAAHHDTIRRIDASLADAVGRATPVGPMRSFPGIVGQFRSAHGPGWALVGDAGYFKDPYAAHGITDAFRDAELLTAAVLDDDLATYEARRDELSLPLFEILDRIASYDWDLETLQGLHFRLSKAMKAEDEQTLALSTV